MSKNSDGLEQPLAEEIRRFLTPMPDAILRHAQDHFDTAGKLPVSAAHLDFVDAIAGLVGGATPLEHNQQERPCTAPEPALLGGVLAAFNRAVGGIVISVKEMLPDSTPQLAFHLASPETTIDTQVRFWKPSPDNPDAAWLDRVELTRQAASGNVRYRATAFAKVDASVAPQTLLVALVAPDGTRSDVILPIGDSPVFPNKMAHNWDEFKLEVRVREDA